MYSPNNMVYILTMLEAIEKISYYVSGFQDEEQFYYADKQMHFNATVNLLIAIGEENKKLDDGLKSSQIINWKNVSALRDKLSHNYRGIDEGIVWDTVKSYLPALKSALIEMISQVEDHKRLIESALKSEYYEDLRYLADIVENRS